MRVQHYLPIAITVVALAACGAPTGDMGADEAGSTMPAASPVTMQEDSPMTPRSSAGMKHMHAHADQLDKMHSALAAGDLEAAATPAYWLSKHETLAGLPPRLQPYLARMRAEANIVEGATDLATARAAAARLQESCEGCHRANEN